MEVPFHYILFITESGVRDYFERIFFIQNTAPMQIYETDDPNPFRVELFRTDDALFIYVPPKSPEPIRRQLRLMKKAAFYFCLFFLFFAISVRNDPEGFFATILIIIFLCVPWSLLLRYISRKQTLTRIDKSTIRETTWTNNPKKRERNSTVERPESIAFFKREGRWFLTVKDKNRWISFDVKDHEFRRIRDAVEQFEKEVPFESPNNEPTASIPDEMSAKKILENQEFRGQKLHRIPRPGEESLENLKNEHILPGTLQVLCGRCNAAIPIDHVLAEEAKAHCPACNYLFEIADLKRRAAPKRTAFEIGGRGATFDAIGNSTDLPTLQPPASRLPPHLLVHQRPRLINVPFVLLAILLYFDLALGAIYLHIQNTNPGTTLQELGFLGPNAVHFRITKILVALHSFCGLWFIWSIFVHKYVEFRRDEIRFRIRWLYFAHSWTVARSRLESLRLSYPVRFWRGFHIPYGKKSFYLGAETLWMVGEINYWLYTHPPLEFHIDNQTLHSERGSFEETGSFPTLGGVVENEKEVCWYCGDCGHVFTAEEMNFPNRTAVCPDCEKTYKIENLRYFYVEKLANKPEDPLFSAESTEEYRLIAVARPVLTPLQWTGEIAGLIFVVLFMFGCAIGLLAPIIFNDTPNPLKPGLQSLPRLLMLGLFFVFNIPIFGLLLFVLGKITDEFRQKSASWSTLFSGGTFVLTRSYKSSTEIITVELNRIVRFQVCDGFQFDFKTLLSRFPSNVLSRGSCGNELLLDDGSTLRLPCFSCRNGTTNAWLVNQWNQSLLESLRQLH